jgi:hypothetical protein
MPRKKNIDAAAAKAKKQKIVLAVAAVLLLGVAAIQGPKLLGGGGTSASSAKNSTSGEPTTVTQETTAALTTPAPSSASARSAAAVASDVKPAAVVAGVGLPAQPAVRASSAQLVSFTLFEAKDPFVQAVTDDAGSGAPQGASSAGPAGTGTPSAGPGSSVASGSSTSPGSGGTAPAPPPKYLYATINLDDTPQQMTLKQTFPQDAPLFVLRGVTKKTANIAVAGGSFADSKTITLKLNKKVTLVNTATGVRYVLKLVYTGPQPELIEGFTQPQSASAGTTTTSTSDASTPTTGN